MQIRATMTVITRPRISGWSVPPSVRRPVTPSQKPLRTHLIDRRDFSNCYLNHEGCASRVVPVTSAPIFFLGIWKLYAVLPLGVSLQLLSIASFLCVTVGHQVV